MCDAVHTSSRHFPVLAKHGIPDASFPQPGTSRRTVAQGNSMKSELIILRGLYAMTALVVIFGICALLLRAH